MNSSSAETGVNIEPFTTPYSPTYTIRHVASEAEIAWMYQLQQIEYGAESIVSFETVLAWNQKFKRAGYRLQVGEECLGGIALWPLKQSSYSNLTEGRLDEHQLTVDDIEADAPGKQFEWWYFADIFIRPEHRLSRQKWAIRLLLAAMEKWLSSSDTPAEVKLCALVYSAQGKSIAERLGLEPCAKTPEGYAVYKREVRADEFLSEIALLKRRFRKWL